jgi:nicotinate-nucleotide pyrophosphorylase (carboxylating)
MVARQDLTLAGIELLPLIFSSIAPHKCEIAIMHESGAHLKKGDAIATVTGPARALLTGERTALNFVQRLSGVATLASAFAERMQGTGCRILDTRKTTPGLRRLEKQAAVAGGAVNYRHGLYDAVLIKNNHITTAGGVRAALEKTHNAGVPVEIEVRTRAELDEALANGATHLLLDNLTPPDAREWIEHIRATNGKAITIELSGGITLANARAYAETGADFLSSGAITHSAPAVDINFGLTLS